MSREDRLFRCDLCGRRFSSGTSLRKHYDLEHTAPRRCRNCGKQLRDDEYHRC
jgi:transcription elongation factor Elf1